MINHPIPPFYDAHSQILILGSFPSVKSREQGFFYGHPQNRFWRVMSEVFSCPIPQSVAEKKAMLLENRVALWDVIASCEIEGSADSTIGSVTPNDIGRILGEAPITRVFVNGKTAEKYYRKYILPALGVPAVCLPSTSPANAACHDDDLCRAWSAILPYLTDSD